jgi:Protein of unknown function (DUF2846)
MRNRIAAALIAVFSFVGCAVSGPQLQAEPSKPDGGRALLYVYRRFTLIGIANPDVPIIHLDGRRLTRIRIGGYFVIPISTGRHKLTTTESLFGGDTGRVRGEATFAAPAGSTLYLRYTESFKSFAPVVLPKGAFFESSGDYRFESVPASEALGELASTKPLELDGKTQ